MEEILQSIKRIIAEEGEPAPSGSDVLELTDLLSEDDAKAMGQNQTSRVGSLSIEEIMAAPMEPPPPPQPTAPEAAPAAAPTPAPATPPSAVVEAVAPPPPPPTLSAPAAPPAPPQTEEPLLSEQTRVSAAAALEALRQVPPAATVSQSSGGMHFRSGETVEDLVLEALRPMLKDWLDEQLTKIVERLVEKEIRRVSSLR